VVLVRTGCVTALVNSIVDLIAGAVRDQVDRETFVKNVLQAGINNTGGRYNVMVFDEEDTGSWYQNHPYTQNLQGVLYQQDFTLDRPGKVGGYFAWIPAVSIADSCAL
jgi:hypothetical protein